MTSAKKLETIDEIRVENARALAKQAGSSAAFARRIDRAPTQVSKLIGGKPTVKIGDDMARHIEDSFGLEKGWLDNNHNQPQYEFNVMDAKTGYVTEDEAYMYRAIYVPIVDWHTIKPNIPSTIMERQDIICPASHSRKTFATRVQGPSMQAPQGRTYTPGSIIFIDPAATIESGDPVVAYLPEQNTATFRIWYNESGEEYLAPLNIGFPITINEPFEIIGKVIGAWTN